MFRNITQLGLLLFSTIILGQQDAPKSKNSKYNYSEAFATSFYNTIGSSTRSASGQPGSEYWQNRANYKLTASLNEQKNEITGTAIIDYTNNSPDKLSFLWMNLDQNLFINNSRGNTLVPITGSRNGSRGQIFDGGHKIKSVKVITETKGKFSEIEAKYFISDTRMQVSLPNELKSKGGSVKIKIEFSYVSPNEGSDRTGVLETKNGKIFEIAQWYPRMCVYDDIRGWNVNPYLGASEFYLEYGDFDVNITAPSNHFVVCSGELVNPISVLSPEEQKRLVEAKSSDKTVFIRTADEVGVSSKLNPTTTKTWHYVLKNARDLSWASSAAFIVDAARINLPSGKKSLALSTYPVESVGNQAWNRATEFTKGSIENYSKRFVEYTYPMAANVAGNVGGMEYPGIVFCNYESKGSRLWGVTDHEFGHNWFPMIVGSNERLHAWMDEGFNSFINSLNGIDFNNGEFKDKEEDMHELAEVYTNTKLEPIMSSPDVMLESSIGPLCYSKPAAALTILREQILGIDRFDLAFKTYINRWAFKHPAPDDFFRTIENVAGEDLSWFWRSWFVNNWRFDQGVSSVKYIKNNPQNGVIIKIENLDKMPLPVVLDIKTKSGKITRVNLPVEVWQRNSEWEFKQNTTEEIETITIDPDHVFPDYNESNNVWKSGSGIVEKDVVLDGYLGNYSTTKAPVKILIEEKNSLLHATISGYPKINLESIGKDLFESNRAGLQFQFNENLTGFDMILKDGRKIPFTRDN